jgi:hypothetical protein
VSTLDFVPHKQLVDRLNAGWRLLPNHDYNPLDWAILMMLPDEPEPVSVKAIVKAFARHHDPKICRVDGCDRPTRARGMCRNHYKQSWQVRRARQTRGWEFADCKLAELAAAE